jgi:prepilin-type N-terminal cleavage/methylation domain-containing protein
MSHLRLNRRGFTMLEMLVALALLGALMVSLNTFLFSMGELWGKGRDQRLFDQHSRAVAEMVRRTFESATYGPGASGVSLKDIDNGSGTTEPRLTFMLADAGRLADWPEGPLPDVDFNVFVDPDRGLIFQWQSRLELQREKTDLHETVISPFVKALHYEYYDATLKEWKTEDEPKHDDGGTAWLKPARLHLIFKFPELKSTPKNPDAVPVDPEVVINIPIKRSGASTP